MDAIEFIRNYKTYLAEIEQVIKPEYLPAINRLKEIDPHDLITPAGWFQGAVNARGYVWSLFLKEVR
jgi:hypothetical protein